jgi:hypothetical protein
MVTVTQRMKTKYIDHLRRLLLINYRISSFRADNERLISF